MIIAVSKVLHGNNLQFAETNSPKLKEQGGSTNLGAYGNEGPRSHPGADHSGLGKPEATQAAAAPGGHFGDGAGETSGAAAGHERREPRCGGGSDGREVDASLAVFAAAAGVTGGAGGGGGARGRLLLLLALGWRHGGGLVGFKTVGRVFALANIGWKLGACAVRCAAGGRRRRP